MKPGPALMRAELPLKLHSRGKVRDTYELDGDRLLMVATDRISAYDHVLPDGIPDRGRVLTQLSIWWFGNTLHFQENHLVSGMIPDLPPSLTAFRDELSGRFMIVRKAQRVDIECVVRGYLAGSGWSEYKEKGTVAGEAMPSGLLESQQLPVPLFTPATKEESGHDVNISFAQMQEIVGSDLAERMRESSLALYRHAAEVAAQRGVILADTKFEFGLVGDRLILIDEVLTPDSSRYWEAASYRPGSSPDSMDKQYVRDWLNSSGWDRESNPPSLPAEVVENTRSKYLQAYEMITGKPLFPKPERV